MSYSLAFSQAVMTVLFVADKIEQGIFDFVPTQTLAEALNISGPSAVKILRSLNRAGIIETKEGRHGGVRMARRPAEVTVLDVFNAIEQGRPMFKTSVPMNVSGPKPTRAQEVLFRLLSEAEQAMKDRLSETTVADLIRAINTE
jgi:Rrf2 family protein